LTARLTAMSGLGAVAISIMKERVVLIDAYAED